MPVTTRPSNAAKKPAQIVLDAQPKRRTSAAVKEEKARLEKERQEQAEEAQKGIAKIAAAQSKIAAQENNAAAARKPRARPVHSRAASMASAGQCDPPATQAPAARSKGGVRATAVAKEENLQDRGRRAAPAAQPAMDLEEVNDKNEAGGRRKRIQKTAHRDAVGEVRASLLLSADSDAPSPRASDTCPKGKALRYVR